jgi:site-specific recombinase XerD
MNAGYNEILVKYLSWLDTLGYSNSIVKRSKSCLNLFFEWLQEKQLKSIIYITDKQIKDYYHFLEIRPNRLFKGRVLSSETLNANYFSIDKFFEFLHQYGMETAPLPTNKRLPIDIQGKQNEIEVLTQSEIKTLYNCIENTYESFNFEERQGSPVKPCVY